MAKQMRKSAQNRMGILLFYSILLFINSLAGFLTSHICLYKFTFIRSCIQFFMSCMYKCKNTMCLRNAQWVRILAAAVIIRLATADSTSSPTAFSTSLATTTTASGSEASFILSGTRKQTSGNERPIRADMLKLHRSGNDKGNSMVKCLSGCSGSRCRESCLQRELSDEEIVERTQKCHNDCKDEPDELIQMCIQKCTYYLMNPEEHNLEDDDTSTSTDEGGLLPDSPHIRTRIRLIGPDGLPVVSTVDYPVNQPSEVSNAISAAAETASDTWTPMYRVSIVNRAAGAISLDWLWGWCAVAAICLALYI